MTTDTVKEPDVISYTHEETYSYTVSRQRVLELLGITVPDSAVLSSVHSADGAYTVYVQTQSTGVMA